MYLSTVLPSTSRLSNFNIPNIMKHLKTNRTLLSLTVVSLTLLFFRILFMESLRYSFLVWNLFLAGIPFLIAFWIYQFKSQGDPRVPAYSKSALIFGATCLWLLFLPNAFYIITDFIHLRYVTNYQFYLDVLLLSSFSVSALALGSASVILIHKTFFTIKSPVYQLLFFVTCSVLCALGVYLGRVLRWNSWDIVTNPNGLLRDILDLFQYNYINKRIWLAMLALSGIYLASLYLSKKFLYVKEIS